MVWVTLIGVITSACDRYIGGQKTQLQQRLHRIGLENNTILIIELVCQGLQVPFFKIK